MSERLASISRTPSPWPLVALALGTAAAIASVAMRPPPPARFVPPRIDEAAARAAPARTGSITMPAPHPSCHAASLAPRPGGGVLVAWFAGSREGAKDVEILFANVSPEGELERSWKALDRAELRSLVGRSIRKIGNPSVAILPNGTIHLFVTSVSVGGWSGSSVNLLSSRGEGEPGSWAGRRLVLSPFLNFSTLVKAPPIAMDGGDGEWSGWGLPAYHEFITTEGLWVRIDESFRVVDAAPMPQPVAALQPAAVAIDAASAVAALRDGSDDEGRVRWSSTGDGGVTWDEAPARDLANPNAAVALATLPDGSLLMAANPLERGRATLALFRSRDRGSTWTRVATIATSRTGASEFSYPSLAVDERGTVWFAYTEQRKLIRLHHFTLAWLDESERGAGGPR
jgi:predicted neuraminidase